MAISSFENSPWISPFDYALDIAESLSANSWFFKYRVEEGEPFPYDSPATVRAMIIRVPAFLPFIEDEAGEVRHTTEPTGPGRISITAAIDSLKLEEIVNKLRHPRR